MKKLKLSPRIQRVFLAWYQQNAKRFAIPLRLTKRNRRSLEFCFVGITPVITVCLSKTTMGVYAEMDDCYFDCILDLDVYLRHSPQGYFCELCDLDSRVFYQTRAEIWHDHQFERFLKWVNEKLAPAHWISLSMIGEGSSWATLIYDENELSQPDSGLLLMQGLKRLDGQPAYDGNPDALRNWLIPLRLDPSRDPSSASPPVQEALSYASKNYLDV